MSLSLRPHALTLAGLGTWAVMASGAWRSGVAGGPWGLAAWALFPFAFVVASTGSGERRTSRVVALGVQSLSVLGATAAEGGTFSGVLLAVVAGQAPMLLSVRVCAVWCAVQTALFGALLSLYAPPAPAAFTAIGFGAFQLFALGAGWFAQREAAARRELAAVNEALVSAQAQLAERSRDDERLRISRELHDTLGHHLTALSLQLELATNTSPHDEAVRKARALAREMLAEVRAVVGELRERPALELRSALGTLAAGVPAPAEVRLHFSDDATVGLSAEVTQALFRCAQEGVTNALRHAGATRVDISLERVAGTLRLMVRDDGRAEVRELVPGNGLRGLRERLQAVGGELRWAAEPGSGVTLTAEVPR